MVVELSVSTKTTEFLRRGAAAIVEYKTACNSLELELIRLSRYSREPGPPDEASAPPAATTRPTVGTCIGCEHMTVLDGDEREAALLDLVVPPRELFEDSETQRHLAVPAASSAED